MNSPSQIFFNDINHGYRAAILKKNSLWLLPPYVAEAAYCCYEKVRRAMRTAIASYLLKTVGNSLSNFFSKYSENSRMFRKSLVIGLLITLH